MNRTHSFISLLRILALVVICAASLLVVFMLPRMHAQMYSSNSSGLTQFENVALQPPLGSHIENIHQTNQYFNRTAHLIVTNHVNDTGCYAECLSANNYTISVLGINPNPRTFKGSEAGTNVTLGEVNYNVTAPGVSTFYWEDISPDCYGGYKGR